MGREQKRGTHERELEKREHGVRENEEFERGEVVGVSFYLAHSWLLHVMT